MQKRKPPTNTSSAVNAAAMQDHLLRKYALANPVRRTSSLSKYGKSILKTSANDEIMQKKLDYDSKLTLAQRLGLVEKPNAPLSHEQWAAVEKKSEMREEYKGKCPICHEHLGKEPTVILSCSHIFHKLCITSFEKYSRTKACPICRKQSYEKKTYKTSQDYYYIYCIVKIQSHIRKYICHEKFIKHMVSHPSLNVQVNRKYAQLHMKRLDFKLNKHLTNKETQIDKLFSDLEQKLAASQAAVSALKNLNRSKNPEFSDVNWAEITVKAIERCEKNCPICLQNLEARRETTILSCSHVFHTKCIESFESFSIQTPCCPVCRAEYIRTTLHKNDY